MSATRELVLSIWVPGVPKSQGSKKLMPAGRPVPLGVARKRPGAYWIGPSAIRPARAIEAIKGLDAWRRQVTAYALAAKSQEPISGPVSLSAVFVMNRPKGHYTAKGNLRSGAPAEPTVTPDLSKLVRAIEDSLTDARIWEDDARVTEYHQISKRYGRQSGVQIAIYRRVYEGLLVGVTTPGTARNES